ncbi:MAG: lipid-A-disaccharide synthase [Pseudomonadales bacterium]|nr:lipid-A-disaccharide synthase [Pseudomonadales bacterium]
MSATAGKPFTIAMVAGEASGDNLGAALIIALKTQHPHIRFVGIGGTNMIAEGFESFQDMETLSVNAFPVMRVPELIKILLSTKKAILDSKPDCFIGIDYNFFNGFLEGMMKRAGLATVHYVSPTIWAWRSGRIRKIKKHIDLMLTLYPFETEIYKTHGIPVLFVGHPKAREIDLDQGDRDKSAARASLGLANDERVVAILPGSRAGEVALIGPDFFRTAAILHKELSCKFVIPANNDKRAQQINALWQILVPEIPVQITDSSITAMSAADTVLVKSGTATLEAMLLRRPMVMSYRLSNLAYALVSRLVNADYFALPNILAGSALVPEFIQDEATPEVLAAAMIKIIRHPQEDLLSQFADIHQQLRGDSGAVAANQILQLCRHVSH